MATVNGTSGADQILGLAGNDLLFGDAGDDSLLGDADAAISVKKITYSEENGRLFLNSNGSANGFGSGGYFVTLQGALALPSLIS